MITSILLGVLVDTAHEGDFSRSRTADCGRAGDAADRGAFDGKCRVAFTQGVA